MISEQKRGTVTPLSPVEKHFVTSLDPLDILDLPNFEKILKITI